MYQALYRKYRPCLFKEIAGQQVVIQILQNALKTSKISHAYMFSGPRGTGKTTIAKLLAKAVNCSNLQDGEPCGVCEHCLDASSKECVDIIEIDAASNNGVDEIRELKNKVNLVPNSLKYKVYIIDEVHMLSIGAFNALLKTLEEPPEHVIFILATTDPQKVPVTIVSRCQCFTFKKISLSDMVDKLSEVAKNENISISSDVIREIARYSDGGMRDALGMLDQLSSYTLDKITLDDFRKVNGLLSDEDIIQLLSYIFQNDFKSVLDRFESLYSEGKDFIQLTNQMIEILRKQLVDFYIHDQSLMGNKDQYYQLILKLSNVLVDMKNTGNVKVLLEMAVIGFMKSAFVSLEKDEVSTDCVDKNVSTVNLEKEESSVVENVESTLPLDKDNGIRGKSEAFISIRINNTFARASKQRLLELKEKWAQLNDFVFNQEFGYLVCILLDGTLRAASNENVIISYPYDSMVEKGYSCILKLEEIFTRVFGISVHLVFITDERWNQEKAEFIRRKNENVAYEYQEEPQIESKNEKVSSNFEQSEISRSAIELFGDIVEIESN